MELFLSGSTICTPKEWVDRIAAIRAKTVSNPEARESLSKAIFAAIRKRVPDKTDNRKIGVLLSGGVDSSLIAMLLKQAGAEFTCYTLGFKNEDTKDPEDVDAARSLANTFGLKLKVKLVDAKEAELLISRTAKILGPKLSNVVNVGVAAVEVGCLDMAKKDGVTLLFGGLGSEEIFAGYERHRSAEEINEECWSGLRGMYERDLLRDFAVASHFNVSFATPFLDKELILLAMGIPGKYKIVGEHSKAVLRDAAVELGLPAEFAWRKKRAAQYGSRIDSAIDKLARKEGFGLKKDYLASIFSQRKKDCS